MCLPPARSCAVNVYVLTAVKLWLATFALAAALYSTVNVFCACKSMCVSVCVCRFRCFHMHFYPTVAIKVHTFACFVAHKLLLFACFDASSLLFCTNLPVTQILIAPCMLCVCHYQQFSFRQKPCWRRCLRGDETLSG